MDTILDSQTSMETTSASESVLIKALSAPLVPAKPDETQLAIQISAPSYLFSLKENEAPPFKKPEKEARPMLLIGTIMNEEEAVEMIMAYDANKVDGLKNYLGFFLVKKKIVVNYNLPEKCFLTGLLMETIDYACQRDFPAAKVACLFTIYLSSHLYFKNYYWSSPMAVWYYFKEIMLRHTIEDSPDGKEVFTPEECYDIITHFHAVYFSNLPLVHIHTFGAYCLKLLWPLKPN